MELIYEKERVNLEKLHEELASVLGVKLVGVSTGDSAVRVHVQADLSPKERDLIAPVILAHDAAQLTTAQQAAADREMALDALRKPWDQWTAQDQADFIRVLAEQAGLAQVG